MSQADRDQVTPEPPPARRERHKQELGRQMRVISEEASCSRWAWRIEDELPPLLEEAAAARHSVSFQGVEISPLYADWLVSMAEELGHWVTQGATDEYVPHIPK